MHSGPRILSIRYPFTPALLKRERSGPTGRLPLSWLLSRMSMCSRSGLSSGSCAISACSLLKSCALCTRKLFIFLPTAASSATPSSSSSTSSSRRIGPYTCLSNWSLSSPIRLLACHKGCCLCRSISIFIWRGSLNVLSCRPRASRSFLRILSSSCTALSSCCTLRISSALGFCAASTLASFASVSLGGGAAFLRASCQPSISFSFLRISFSCILCFSSRPWMASSLSCCCRCRFISLPFSCSIWFITSLLLSTFSLIASLACCRSSLAFLHGPSFSRHRSVFSSASLAAAVCSSLAALYLSSAIVFLTHGTFFCLISMLSSSS
mmetsp:Transcript_4364/g.10943  ORF Transcript_4364/g.10943 Transcript_4364/m.10943 type:complete len:324 (-) Transcript_4364:845-1816(-)